MPQLRTNCHDPRQQLCTTNASHERKRCTPTLYVRNRLHISKSRYIKIHTTVSYDSSYTRQHLTFTQRRMQDRWYSQNASPADHAPRPHVPKQLCSRPMPAAHIVDAPDEHRACQSFTAVWLRGVTTPTVRIVPHAVATVGSSDRTIRL